MSEDQFIIEKEFCDSMDIRELYRLTDSREKPYELLSKFKAHLLIQKGELVPTKTGINLTLIESDDHDLIILRNKRGDTYSSRSEDLADFLFDAEEVAVNVITDQEIDDASRNANGYLVYAKEKAQSFNEGFKTGIKWYREQLSNV